jgi:hypothetical protein
VGAVNVQVGTLAVRPEPRPRRVQRVVIGEDLDSPVRRVADDLARARRDEQRLSSVEVDSRSA